MQRLHEALCLDHAARGSQPVNDACICDWLAAARDDESKKAYADVIGRSRESRRQLRQQVEALPGIPIQEHVGNVTRLVAYVSVEQVRDLIGGSSE